MDRIRKALDLAREKRVQPFASTVEKPRPVVVAVESLGPFLRSVEKPRPVVVALEKPTPVESSMPGPDPLAAEQPPPQVAKVQTPRQSVPTEESAAPFVSALESPAVTNLPMVIQYTKTKTFSPSSAWLESNRVVDVSGSNAAAAAFRVLRTQVLQRMVEHDWRSIAVISPGSKDGKTTTAINLAISLANDQRHTVLLVEFDLKRPIIAKRLGIDAEIGADDVLRGTARVEECLYHPDGFDRFVVMPARARMDHSSEMLAGPRCREIVAELRARYPERILVFDLPPVLGADDALAFIPLVDCALIVVAEGSTPRADLVRCLELLRNTPVVGTVLNLSTGAGSAYG
jgi:protein-tyrosine kinase